MAINITRYPDAAAFLDAAEPFLLEHEVENNAMIGISRSVANGMQTPAEPYFATASDEHGIRIAVFRTLTRTAGVTRPRYQDAVAPLAAALSEACPAVEHVAGMEPELAAFARAVAAVRGNSATMMHGQRLYQLTRVAWPVRPPAGAMRPASFADLELLKTWVQQFMIEIGDLSDPRDIAREKIESGALYIWEDNGTPRSMAAWAGPTPNGVRINFVYTPPEARGHGYASATVAALSQRMLDSGFAWCCLYTDLSNPTSNSIYQKIGYRPVSDAAVYSVGSRTV